MSDIWDDVSSMLEELKESDGRSMTSGELSVITSALEEALASPDKGGLRRASETLERSLRAMLAVAPPQVKAAVAGERNGSIATAFALGQISAAQAIAAHAFTIRADASFAEDLTGGRFETVGSALLEGEADVRTLQERSGLSEVAFTRDLMGMVRAGAADFRRDGRTLTYFLTPPAKAVLQARATEASAPGPR